MLFDSVTSGRMIVPFAVFEKFTVPPMLRLMLASEAEPNVSVAVWLPAGVTLIWLAPVPSESVPTVSAEGAELLPSRLNVAPFSAIVAVSAMRPLGERIGRGVVERQRGAVVHCDCRAGEAAVGAAQRERGAAERRTGETVADADAHRCGACVGVRAREVESAGADERDVVRRSAGDDAADRHRRTAAVVAPRLAAPSTTPDESVTAPLP